MGLHTRAQAVYDSGELKLAAEDIPDTSAVEAAFNKAVKWLHGERVFSTDMLKEAPVKELIEATTGYLAKGIERGIEQSEPTELMKTQLRQSAGIFSGFKTFHEMKEAAGMLLDENGNIKPFERFYNDVQKLNNTYNRNYLRTEYDFAVISSERAARWEEQKDDGGGRYMLQYRTMGDEKVRASHRKLNGVTLPASDPFWDEFYPPNGWNCFTEGTPVLTSEGWKPIESIRKGDSVIGGSGQFRIVIGTHAKTVNEEVIRIITKGTIATCTKNHRFCTPDGWVMAACLKPGDIIIQVGKNSTLNKIINAICNTYTILRYAFMTFITKRKAVSTLTVDHKTHGGDVKVHNIRAKKTARLEFQGFSREIIKHDYLGFTQWLSKSTHALGMKSARCKGFRHGFFSYFRTQESGILFKFISNLTDKFAVFFCLALAYMSTLKRKFMIGFRKNFTRVQTTQGVVNPLGAHGISTVARGDVSFPENAEYSPVVNAPVGRKPTGTAMLSQIPLFCGITDIHSFNGFNSFYDFLRNTFTHTRYAFVEDKVIKNKAERVVYNLSVDEDESYIVPVGITHNCRCLVTKVRAAKYPKTGSAEARARGEEAVEGKYSKMFRFNPGKDKAVFPAYNSYTISKCSTCQQNGYKLAKIPNNELCAACAYIRQMQESEQQRRLTQEERRSIRDAALEWANEHLPRVTLKGGVEAQRAYITIEHSGDVLVLNKETIKETYTKNQKNRRLAETMDLLTKSTEWMPDAHLLDLEDGKHHNFKFRVYEATVDGVDVEFKAKDLPEKIIYNLRIK